MEQYRKALEIEEGQSLIWKEQGLAQYVCKSYPEAIESYNRALELNPYASDVHNNLGLLYADLGNLREAEKQFYMVLKDKAYGSPENAYYNLGKLYYHEQRYGEAEEAFKQACRLRSDLYVWQHHLGLVREKMGKYDEAIGTFKVVLQSEACHLPSLLHVGQIYMKLNKRQKASEYFNDLIRCSPVSDEAATARQYLKAMGE